MRKIGIITFHRAHNYGAVLQNYALQKYLIKNNINVETIDYKSKSLYNMYKVFYMKNFSIKSIAKQIYQLLTFVSILKTKKKFESFVNENLVLSKYTNNPNTLKSIMNKYDYLISGSDQVWNKELTCSDYNIYDLSFIESKNVKKIAYAASIGNDIINESNIEYYKNLIDSYDSVSVREKSLINKLNNNKIKQVMDPVFLLDNNEWKKLCIKKNKEKNIFIFSLQRNGTINKIIDELVNKFDYKIYYYSKYPIFKKNVKIVNNFGPKEFVSYINNADFVISNSFHCLSLSIILNKQFATVLHNSRSNRQKDLLDSFELLDRIYDNKKSIIEYINNQIDYDRINKIINNKVTESKEFINHSIL